MRWMIVAMLGLGLSVASPVVRADDASRLKVAHEVVVTAHMADNMRKLLPTMMQQMRPMLLQQGNNDAKAVDAFLARFSQRFDQSADRFSDLAAEIYAREFSEEDLGNLLTFYKSETGQRLLDKQTIVAQAMMIAGQRWGETEAKQIIDEFQKEKSGAAPKL